MKKRHWNCDQTGDFLSRFSNSWRSHWHLIPPAIREHLIDSFVLGIVAGQDDDSVAIAAIDELRETMRANVNANFPS